MIWVILLAMAALAAAALLLPLRRTTQALPARSAYDLEVYRDQLAELERERARNLIGEAEAKAARAEIARRMLAAADENAAPAIKPGRARGWIAWTLGAAAPAVALALYAVLGSPNVPSVPHAERRVAEATADEKARAQVTRMVATLAERLQQNPDDLQGWLLLGRSLNALGRYGEAVTAWRRVMALSGDAVEHAGSFAETLVQAAGGVVTPEARTNFERVLAADPLDVRARFYLGLAHAQAGEDRAALQMWTDLLAVSPADAPWVADVRQRIRETAATAGIDPASIAPSPEVVRAAEAARRDRGPSAADVEAMRRLSPEARRDMVRGMVEGLAARLEAEPGDVEGWRRLGRAWHVLGERDKAVAAIAKAAALAPDRVDVLTDYAEILFDESAGDAQDPRFFDLMRQILKRDPDNADALWYVGIAEARAGNRAAAAEMWRKLRDRLPADSPERAHVEQRLETIATPN
ncbi:MAG TPA: c-type cytochrome biogenesis protein CcmI [Alphaproteobacteria bacterium]